MQNDKDVMKNKYLPNIPGLESKKNQKYLGIILTFCALSFFGFFAIKPTVSKIFKLQKEISDSEIVLEKLNTKIGNLAQLKTQYSNLQSDLPVVMNAIPIRPEISLLLGQIQSAGKISNININKLQSSEIQIIKIDNSQKPDYNSYSFSVAGNGTSENIYKFLHTITDMERVVNIDTFSILNTVNQASGSQQFNIQGTVVFKNDF
jgi:Tfp pilus assembly protein PilO